MCDLPTASRRIWKRRGRLAHGCFWGFAGLSSINVLVECSAVPRTDDDYLLVDMDFTNVVAETNDANNVGVLALS